MARHIEALYEVQKRLRPKSYRQLKRELGLDVASLVDTLEGSQEALMLPASDIDGITSHDAPTSLVVPTRTRTTTDKKTIPMIRKVAK